MYYNLLLSDTDEKYCTFKAADSTEYIIIYIAQIILVPQSTLVVFGK